MRYLAVWTGALVCSAVLADAPSSQPQAPVPIEHFTRHDEFGWMTISPDGRTLAFTAGKYGRSMLAFMDVQSRKIVGGARTGAPGLEIDDFDWVSPTRLIYKIAQRQPGLIQPVPTGEIFAIDRDGGRNKLIYGYRAGEQTTGTNLRVKESSYATAELISMLRNDTANILIAEYPWRLSGNYWRVDRDAPPLITKLDVVTGRKRGMGAAPLAMAQVLIDQNDDVRFALGLNSQQQMSVSWRPQPNAPWTAFELPGFQNDTLKPRRFSTDNHSVLFTGVREGETFAALYRLDLQSRELEQVHAFEDRDVGGLIADFADREIIGVSGYADQRVTHWLKPDDRAAQLRMALHRAFPRQTVRVTSASEDGSLALVLVHSDVNPGDYYLFDTRTMKADFLQATRQWIDPARMRPKQPIQLSARDGLALSGYLTEPAGERPHPLVVLPHGGPHGIRDTWEFDWEAQLLASRGYAVLQLNYRGSDGFGVDFETAGYREWGGLMQDDLTDATRWAIEQKIAPADRICIYGASYGGYAALMGAVREPSLYRCAIGYAGVYDLELMYKSGDIPGSRGGRAYLERVLGTDVELLRSRSPAQNAQYIQIPVLLVHGKEDWRADYDQATAMKKALEKHGKKFEWMVLSREGHGVYDEDTRLEVYQRILAFLDRHLR